jgi:hypothetical protein
MMTDELDQKMPGYNQYNDNDLVSSICKMDGHNFVVKENAYYFSTFAMTSEE